MIIPIHNAKVSRDSGRLIPRKRVYTVWVVPRSDGAWKMYNCPDCRNPIAQYKGDLVVEIPGESPEPYPIMVQCKNPKCGRKVVFEKAVPQVF